MRVRAALLVVLLSTSCSSGGGGDSSPPPPPPPPPGQPVTLGGTVTYDFVPAVYSPQTDTGKLDFANVSLRPVRFAKVQVSQGATVLAVVATDAAGHYSITFTPVTAETPVLAALAETAPSVPSIRVQDNTDGNKVWAVGANVASGVTTIDLHATHGWTGSSYDPNRRIAAPFAILDSMYTAEKRFIDVRPAVVFPPLRVNWSPNNVPQPGDVTVGDISTSHYNPSTNQIYILGKDGVDTDEFDAHVIVHEWGHFFEDNLSRSDSPGGPHSTGDLLDPRLALGEGYGNAIAAMLLPESIYADTFWNPGLQAFGFDAETVPSPTDDLSSSSFAGGNPGPFSEFSILRILYDLYDDSGNVEPWDHVALGLGPIYDTLVGPERTTDALTTIASFVAGLKAQPGIAGNAATLANIDAVLADRNIGAITDQWGTGDARLMDLFRQIPSLPSAGNVATFDGGFGGQTFSQTNKRQTKQYFVVTGTGSQITVTATSLSDVGLEAFQTGNLITFADSFAANATETLRFQSVNGTKYVIVLTGFEQNAVSYTATVSVTSP